MYNPKMPFLTRTYPALSRWYPLPRGEKIGLLKESEQVRGGANIEVNVWISHIVYIWIPTMTKIAGHLSIISGVSEKSFFRGSLGHSQGCSGHSPSSVLRDQTWSCWVGIQGWLTTSKESTLLSAFLWAPEKKFETDNKLLKDLLSSLIFSLVWQARRIWPMEQERKWYVHLSAPCKGSPKPICSFPTFKLYCRCKSGVRATTLGQCMFWIISPSFPHSHVETLLPHVTVLEAGTLKS